MSRLISAKRGQLVGRFLDKETPLRIRACQSVSGGNAMPGWLRGVPGARSSPGQVQHRRFDPFLLPFCQAVPPNLESSGSVLAAADVFLHQIDLRRRHKHARAFAEFQDQMLLGVAVLVQNLHAAVASDPVADVHDEVAFIQVEEAVDRPRLETPARLDGRIWRASSR